MCELLTRLKYQVGDVNGNRFRRWNIFGIVCLAVYLTVSMYNLLMSSPSYEVWLINLAVIGKIIAKNKVEIKEFREFYKKSKNWNAYNFINWHSNKLTVEVTFAITAFVIFVIGVTCELHFGIDRMFGCLFAVFGGFTILVSGMEELFDVLLDMYEAEKPSQKDE